MFNPFPGLRPFEPEEDHLFFGREQEIDDLLRRLRSSRFQAVVGTSGSGKSSLVRSGLIPSLHSGFMAGAGSSWRVAMLRPGEDPIGHLAAAVAAPDVLGDDTAPDLASTARILVEATLRRSSRGLVEAVRQARIPRDHNILVVVDQFEELFRFRRGRQAESARDEAVAFVKLLLEATSQPQLPIFVVLTMRSDFIGDCMHFPGLPEAINAGLFLVGRMSRDALRSAITGPVAVAGGTIAPRLVNRVLNDLGDDQDQLPLVQHALMRTWDAWERTGAGSRPIDFEDYEAIGTFANALSMHAEEAYEEAVAAGGGRIAERLFKALTDTYSDPRGVRRPTAVRDLAAICEAPDADVVQVVEIFRRAGRSFLTPPPSVALDSSSIIVDLSHESLMRCWERLIRWAEEERAAASFFVRLSQAAAWFEEGTAGLWRNPELELAERWHRDTQPSAAWASRYDDRFARAMAFLQRSVEERQRLVAEREQERRAKLRRAHATAGVLATLLLIAVALAYVARRESSRAEANLALAREAVDESLSTVDRDPERMATDVPQVQRLRQELLAKAERFYIAFMSQEPRSEKARSDLAFAHLRIGHINRMLERPDQAMLQYRVAIERFEELAVTYPGQPEYRRAAANAFNWLGETFRQQPGRAADAEGAYNSALRLQQALAREFPGQADYREELARSLYNRGILLSATSAGAGAAEADFREAIRLLEPLASDRDRAAQETARAHNNLAGLLAAQATRVDEAQRLYERAIAIDEGLVARDPANREYKLELAKFCNNLAALLHERGDVNAAARRSRQAIALIETLAEIPPSLAIERADAHSLRGLILAAQDAVEAEREYSEALDLFAELGRNAPVKSLPDFHLRFGDLLVNLATYYRSATAPPSARRLLARAVDVYAGIVTTVVATGSDAEKGMARETLSPVLPLLPEPERARLTDLDRQLSRQVGGGAPRR